LATYTITSLSGPGSTLNMDALHIGDLTLMSVLSRTPDFESLEIPIPNGSQFDLFSSATISGANLGYSALGDLLAGTLQGLTLTHYNPTGLAILHFTGISSTSPASLATWIRTDATATAFSGLLSGNDVGQGSAGADLMRGYDGDDVLSGAGGSDTIYGGLGNDQIYGSDAPGPNTTADAAFNYLRGEEGNDTITGAQGFDDINGNQGDDVLRGGDGDDWVVGGKDNDSQFGDSGNDIVWGNLGADTLDGGDGADQVRGGQGDDVVNGGAGNDFVSGDRGNDTITGGAGADLFHGSQDAGIDRVLDFHLSEGDKVLLDPGTTFTVSQVGADTVLDMGGGNQMILVGVQMSSLPPGTIFLG
jgi:Ca2+-binding RTX toxin-like protein